MSVLLERSRGIEIGSHLCIRRNMVFRDTSMELEKRGGIIGRLEVSLHHSGLLLASDLWIVVVWGTEYPTSR